MKTRVLSLGLALTLLLAVLPFAPFTAVAEASQVPGFDIQLSDADWLDLQNNRCTCIGTVVFNGRVWTGVEMRKAGYTSLNRAKGSYRLDFPAEDPFEAPFLDKPADELTIDFGYPHLDLIREKLAWDMIAEAGFDPIQSGHVRVSHNGDFFGLYLLREEQDGKWRARHGLDNGLNYKFEGCCDHLYGFRGTIDKKEGFDQSEAALAAFGSCLAQTGAAVRSCMLDQADIPQLVNELALMTVINQTDQREFNFFLNRDDSENGLWRIQPDDPDRSMRALTSDSFFNRCVHSLTQANEVCRAFMRTPDFRTMYNRRVRTLADELLADPTWQAEIARLATLIEQDWQQDAAKWGHGLSFSSVVSDLQNWHTSYLSYLRSGGYEGAVPAAQSASPKVDAIEYRPDAGDGVSFVKFRNSTAEAVDMSNWSLGGVDLPEGLVVLPGDTVVVSNDDAWFRLQEPGFDGIRGYIDSALSGSLNLLRRDGSFVQELEPPWPPVEPSLILNEWNAVGSTKVLAGGDSYFGSVVGNGGDWFELVVVRDHVDVRGWQLELADSEDAPGEVTDTFVFADDPLLADLRAGTIITVSENSADDVSFSPAAGDWWINLQAESGDSGQFFTAASQSNFDTNNGDWQLRILDASGVVTFGPAGEGAGGLTGVGSTEIGELEADPSRSITPLSGYGDGDASTFGAPNGFDGRAQDFALLRSWFVVDSESPVTVVTSPTDGEVLASGEVELTGSVTDNTGVSRVRIAIVDVATGDFLQADGTFASSRSFRNATLDSPGAPAATWTTSLTLPDGKYRLLVKANDAASNNEPTKRVVFDVASAAVDETAPVSVLSSPAGPAVVGPTITIAGSASDDIGVTRVRVGLVDTATGHYLQADGNFAAGWAMTNAELATPGSTLTDWSFVADVSEGRYRLLVKANDAAGNTETTQRLTFDVTTGGVIDDVAPTSTISSGLDQPVGPATIAGSAEDNIGVAQVRVWLRSRDNPALWVQADGSLAATRTAFTASLSNRDAPNTTWTLAVTLPAGRLRAIVKATDTSANDQDGTTASNLVAG